MALLPSLYCQEETLWSEPEDTQQLNLPIDDDDAHWPDLLTTLTTKQHNLNLPDGDTCHLYLHAARRRMVAWVTSACARHGFSALTALLAVSYLDRCFLNGNLGLEGERPWMERLASVACVSIAAKVEETHVPLLLDLQAAMVDEDDEVGGWVFEAKTVRRMEFLVLSTLGWRMNPVTPMSFIHQVMPKIVKEAAAGVARLWELLRRCHVILLSLLADWRWVQYPSSVWAGATLLHVMGHPMEPNTGASSETHHLLALLGLTQEGVTGCYELISESIVGDGVGIGYKRKLHSYNMNFYVPSSPSSPSGVIGTCFSNEDSNSDWSTMWPSSVSSSPEPPPLKRPNCGIAGDDE